jgi:hypothetical protein
MGMGMGMGNGKEMDGNETKWEKKEKAERSLFSRDVQAKMLAAKTS